MRGRLAAVNHGGRAALWWLLIVVVAIGLRMPDLRDRPMHADEAILAFRLGTLLETGSWVYDASEMHGPALPYVSLVPAWLMGKHRFQDLTEVTLRVVPAFFGVLLVLTPLLLSPWLGEAEAMVSSTVLAISPAMVYYSRYYIPEMVLTCLTGGLLICAYRYQRAPSLPMSLGAGLLFGLMFATKETAIVATGCMMVAAVVTWGRRWPVWVHVFGSIVVAVVLVFLLLGFRETLHALEAYIGRGVRGGRHVYPWHYYLDLLVRSRSDVLIVMLAIVGGIVAVKNKELRFLGVYTLLITLAYALIPYKTPWCLLSFLYGMILLAGVGLVWLIRVGFARVRPLVLVVGVMCAAVLVVQAWKLSRILSSDPANPYAYAQATRDLYSIQSSVEKFVQAHAERQDISIQVISRENVWPLPWYFRALPRVEWRRAVNNDMQSAPLILVSPDEEVALAHRLYEVPPPGQRPLYVDFFPQRMELRPGVELKGYVLQSLSME